MFVPFIQSIYSIFCSFFHWFVYLFVCLFICIHTLYVFFYFLFIYFVLFICSLIRLFFFIYPFLCSLILLTDTFIHFCLLVYLVICSLFHIAYLQLFIHYFNSCLFIYLSRPLKIIWNLCQYVLNETMQQFTVGICGVDSITDYNEFCFVSQK